MIKKVLVTGAARYIGNAVCSLFASDGWQVGALDLLEALGVCFSSTKCDLSDPVATKKICRFSC